MMGSYAFRIYDIDWPDDAASKIILPDEAIVILPSRLVEANTINDEEWDQVINDRLIDQFGTGAEAFSFEPHEEDDD
jgi:hypothetical protein